MEKELNLRDWPTVSVKGQRVNIWGFVGRKTLTQKFYFATVAGEHPLENMEANVRGCFNKTLFIEISSGPHLALGLILSSAKVQEDVFFLMISKTQELMLSCQRCQASCFWWTVGWGMQYFFSTCFRNGVLKS